MLDTDRFRTAWAEWQQHKKEIGNPLRGLAATKLLNKLAKWGEGRAVAAIDHSIENGWKGVFEPKEGDGSTSDKPVRRDNCPTDEELENYKPSGMFDDHGRLITN